MAQITVPERGIMSRFPQRLLEGLQALATRRTYYDGQLIHQRGSR